MNGFTVLENVFVRLFDIVNQLFEYYGLLSIVCSVFIVVLGVRFILFPLFGVRTVTLGSDMVRRKRGEQS